MQHCKHKKIRGSTNMSSTLGEKNESDIVDSYAVSSLLEEMSDKGKLFFFEAIKILIVTCFAEFAYRIFLVISELIFYRCHYMTPVFKNIIFTIFNYSTLSLILMVLLALLFFGLLSTTSFKEYLQTVTLPIVSAIFIAVFLLRSINLFYQKPKNHLQNLDFIRGVDIIDYGGGMATSYYYGYLNLVLPNKEYANTGIVERIETYEDSQGVLVPEKKLFIMVPLSCHLPVNLVDKSKILEQVRTLEEVRLDRAGVKRREYKNSMYKIKNSYKWYVVAEGATPLLTFKEALSHHPAIELMQREIVLKFYKTLTDLIYKNEATRGLCELIFYDDIANPNLDLGVLIEERIKQLQGIKD